MGQQAPYRLPARRVLTLGLAAVLGLGMTSTAMAWNQLVPPGPNKNAALPCNNVAGDGPCIEWPKTAGNLSVTVKVYLSSLLSQQEVDLQTDVRNTFPQWNGVAARNPHLQETVSTADELVWVTTESLSQGTYASTSIDYDLTAPFNINTAIVKFSTNIVWNRSYDYHCEQVPPERCWADARKVAMHEFGHVEGLGHVSTGSSTLAVMKQGSLSYHWPRGDDHNGIIAIYGAYP